MPSMHLKRYLTIFTLFLFITTSVQRVPECITAPCYINDESVSFFVIGDFGGKETSPYATAQQINAANGLNKIQEKFDCQFYVSTGDHIYPKGVTDVNDFRFQSTFEDVYKKAGHRKPWYLVAGNHDYLGNITAQLAYTDLSKRWNYPSLYYKVSYNVRKFAVEFLMIDTIILCGNIFDSAEMVPPGPKDIVEAEKHWKWIEDNLSSSRASYIFLVGHYPVRSKGRNGKSVDCLQKRMEDLMKKYSVTAYLCGHDHNLQHLQYQYSKTRTLNYVVSGMGAVQDLVQISLGDWDVRSKFFFPDAQAKGKKFQEDGGFVVGKLNNIKGLFMFFNAQGDKLYHFYFSSRF